MLGKLEERLGDTSPKYWVVGDIIGSMADYLKMYTNYCSNRELSLSTIDKCMTIPTFKEWLEVS
jgi:hypothetical protein